MATTIKIEDPIRPVRSIGTSGAGGVYPIRARSVRSVRSLDRRSLKSVDHEKEDPVDEDSGLRREGDFKQKQVTHIQNLPLTYYANAYFVRFSRARFYYG